MDDSRTAVRCARALDALSFLLADVTRATGRFNLAQGLVATCQGAGASASGLAAGMMVDHAGCCATFLTLGAAALVALGVFALAMPETRGT